MKKLFHFKLKKNILVLMMIVCLCPVLSVSYAAFVFNTEEYRASEMYIGKLLYGMKINNEAVSEITVSPGNTEVVVEVTSLNEIGSNYKLVYESNNNLLLRYANDENEPTYGLITTTKTSTILISNTSNEDITVKFNIVGGYKTNELSQITIPNEYTEITGDYTKYDFSIVSMYVDDVLVEELDSEKQYGLVDYSCLNGETITWDSSTNTIVVTPLTHQTKCSVYFQENSIWYNECASSSNNLNCKMITVANALPSSDENINFAYSSDGIALSIDQQTGSETTITDQTRVTNGLYYTSHLNLTEDYNNDGVGERVYYYRGAVENNNVKFGGFCWRIVRTNEDGSVRLRYNGYNGMYNGMCPPTGSDVSINSGYYQFNSDVNDPKYNEYVFTDGSGESDIKETVEDWYVTSGLINYENQISNVPYCVDKSNPITGVGGNIYYGVINRFIDKANNSVYSNPKPVYKCLDASGKHTVSGDSWGGTGRLSHPIGLLTADEVAYAGIPPELSITSNYLYTGYFYWLISPAFFDASNESTAYSIDDGYGDGLYGDRVNYDNGVVPVISLRPEVTVSSTGDGSYTNPYVVEGSDFNVITFTVRGVTYYAQEGMTYYDWAISSYAPAEYNEYYSNTGSSGLFIEPISGQYHESSPSLCTIQSQDVIVDGTYIQLSSTKSLCS